MFSEKNTHFGKGDITPILSSQFVIECSLSQNNDIQMANKSSKRVANLRVLLSVWFCSNKSEFYLRRNQTAV